MAGARVSPQACGCEREDVSGGAAGHDVDARVAQLLAKQDILELSVRYMRALDRLDAPLQLSVFHDDATTDYGFFRGTAQAFVAFAQQALAGHLANHHLIGQALIVVDGEHAVGEVYFHAFHRIVVAGAEQDLIIAGRYLDRYERRAGVWKISYRSEVNDWARSSPAADEWLRQTPTSIRGARGEADPSHALLRGLIP